MVKSGKKRDSGVGGQSGHTSTCNDMYSRSDRKSRV